jgi:SAM-dependent methyltransferase
MERYKAHGVGIDPDGAALAQCRVRSVGRVPAEHLELHQMEVSAFTWPSRSIDAAICIGASHAFGGYLPMLQELSRRVRAGGLIVVGDLYWRKEPEPDYKQVLGEGMPSFSTDHAALARSGDSLQLVPIYSARSNEDEWDHFEGCFALNGYVRALSNPDKAERENAIAKSRCWHDAYLRWGHAAMGFGYFVFLKPEA